MKNIHIILYTLLMLTAMACRNHAEEIRPDREEGPVLSFFTDASDRSTRASQEVTGSLLHDLGYQTFGIWTWRTADGADWRTVMDGYHVSYNAKYVGEGRTEYGWGYDQEAGFEHQMLKYWNLSYQKYQFHGYAPWVGSAASTNPYVSMDSNRKLLFHNVSGHFATKSAVTEYSDTYKDQVDWLYTYVERSMTGLAGGLTIDRDLSVYKRTDADDTNDWLYIGNTDATPYKLVPLRFHHLLPKVVFRLKVYDSTNEELEIYQKIGLSVLTHEDALDHTKDTKLITKGETVDYYPTFSGTEFPVSSATYVTNTTPHESTEEFVDNTMFPPFGTPVFKSFKKSNGTQTVDVSPYVPDADGKPTREGWLELPQKAPAFDVKLSFGGVNYARTLDPAINSVLPQLWEPDHIYIYEIKFNVSAPTLEVTSYMEEWKSESGDFNLSDW